MFVDPWNERYSDNFEEDTVIIEAITVALDRVKFSPEKHYAQKC